MEVPKYLQILWAYKWLLLFGIVVSLVAGVLSGFRVVDGELVPRVERTYRAATTVMLTSQTPTLFQTEIPPEEIDPEVVTTDRVQVSLSDAAMIYAYLVSSIAIREEVETRIGDFSDEEDIIGQGRISQPGDDTAVLTSSRLSLPLIDVIGISTSPVRAEEISSVANEAFQEYVLAQQDEIGVPEELRVVLTTLRNPASDTGTGSNPAIPVVVTFLGSMAAFVGLAYLLYAGQVAAEARRRRKREIKIRRRAEAAALAEEARASAASETTSRFAPPNNVPAGSEHDTDPTLETTYPGRRN